MRAGLSKMLNSTLLISNEFNIILIEYILNWISNIDDDINLFICLDDIDFTENKVDLYCMYF